MAIQRRDGWDTWVRVAAVAALTGCSGESVIAVDAQTAAPDLGAAIDVVADVGSLDRPTPDAGTPDAGTPDVPPLDTTPFRCSARVDCAGNAAGPACDVATGRCVPCTPADDPCAAGSYCTPTSTCSPGCRDDGACAAATDAGVDRGRCDPGVHQCVACLSDDHCPPGNLCVGNVCVAGCSAARSCPTGGSCCEGACVDLQSSAVSCGACGARCTVTNGTASCQNARCTVAVCTLPFADCDRSARNGCEADTRSDVAHCGGCGAPCDARPNTVATCALGRCVRECVAGYADCDGNAANGCEADLRSDLANCGACRAACAAGDACVGSRCAPDLSSGRLAWYRFDGSLTDSVRGAAGLGVAGGSASSYVAGRHGGALALSGSAFVDVPDLPEQHVVTVAAWVRDVTRPGHIVDAWTRTENYLLQAASVGGAVRLSGGFHDWPDTSSVFPEIRVTSGAAAPADRWHLGVATYDGGTLRLYADAVLQGSATTNRGAAYSAPGARVADLRIGVDRAGGTIAATIDEVMIWNRALSQQEISALYEAP